MKPYGSNDRHHAPECMCDACCRRRAEAGHTWECKPSDAGCGITCKPVRPECCEAQTAPCDRPCPPHRPPRPPKPPCDWEDECGQRCPGKKKPFPPHGFLLPRIIASGREWQRRCVVSLCVSGLPPCAEPPFTLCAVTVCGDMPRWHEAEGGGRGRMQLHVTIPVACQVRDKNGCLYTGRSTMEMDAALRLTMPQSECWRASMVVLPCVRLVCVPPPQCEPCFDAQLEVLLECYLTRWEPCMVGTPKPVCPDLPLYPQPPCR